MHTTIILGAGPMGLACALRLLKRGRAVTVLEADDRIGGMSASFDFGGLRLERYYHFICGGDGHTFGLLRELGIESALRWTDTKMGLYHGGRLHRWGDPLSLLAFPGLDLVSKLRYGLHALSVKRVRDWSGLDRQEASDWIVRWTGQRAYDVLWRPLFEKKFFELSRPLSAAWIGTRIRRVGNSRKSVFQERMGYLEGGTDILLDALRREIERLGGEIRLETPAERVIAEGGAVRAVLAGGRELPCGEVVSTVPLPYLPGLVPDLPAAYRDAVRAIRNIGVVCVVLKLRRALTDNFWLNVSDPEVPVPGFIEYSNLRPLPEAILYAPYYMPPTHPAWGRPPEAFVEEVAGCLGRFNPAFRRDWVLDGAAFRYDHAQPVCPPGFFAKLPPYDTGIRGLLAADTTHSYPEDRSINESVRVAGELCACLA
jgi:protoporphyrinogen oxidase